MKKTFAALHSCADPGINAARTADVELTITLGGKPIAGKEVHIEQTKHAFLFGCNGFNAISLANGELEGEAKAKAEEYGDRLLDICNFITLPFYWGGFEPERGKPNTKKIMAAAKWFAARGCAVKGHPLCWHTMAPDWLLRLSNAEILKTLLARTRREVSDFMGTIDIWDAVNEAVIMPIFDKYDNGITRVCDEIGRIKLIKQVFAAARETNPGAALILNDFDYTTPYEILVEGCLEAGVPIDAIGIQSHMHQGYWGAEKTLAILERYERFKLPIHFSETSIVSGKLMPPGIVDLNDYKVESWPSTPEGEERQAAEVPTHYKTLMSRPLVRGITWWDLVDGNWLKAPSGLIRSDLSPKPAFLELKKLIKDECWGKPARLAADSDGIIRLNAFPGSYTLRVDGKKADFRIEKAGAVSARVEA